MQDQIEAIKQLLETNSTVSSQIEKILVESLGDRASWENASLYAEFSDFTNNYEVYIPANLAPFLTDLWRSRIALNDARINAEETNLDDFLDKPDSVATKDWENFLAPNLDTSNGAVDEALNHAFNPALLEEIADYKNIIKDYKNIIDDYKEVIKILKEDRDREIDSLKAKIKSFDIAEWTASKGTFDETLHRNFLQKIWEQEQELKEFSEGFEILVTASNELDRKYKLDIAERDRKIDQLKQEPFVLKAIIEDLGNEREKLDLKIAILEENLDRARTDHLEQLRAIAQYVEQLSNFPNVNEQTLGAIYLLSKVIWANIERLDPRSR